MGLRVAFPVFYNDSYENKKTGVWGDEIAMRSCAKVLQDNGYEAGLYTREQVKNTKADICIYSNYQLIHPLVVKKIAPCNILWIQGFTYDNGRIIPLDYVYDQIKGYYDLVITSSRTLAKQFDIPFVLPFNGNEDFRKVETRDDFDVSFIGNILKPIDTNVQYLRPLTDYRYGIFGGDFGKVGHERALEVISGSKVNLSYGFKECEYWDMVIARPFYHSLCEAFTMMDRVPWYMETFGKSICFTEGGDDEKEKLKYYLENEEMRKSMAKEAFEIAKSIKNDNLLKIIKGV